jgi:2-(1,2-epoxy-1,2-dihydrophenyl)acetyl-CoA isomerase
MSDLVILSRENAVAELSLNRPQRHNSLVPELLEAVLDGLWQISANSSVRAVVLRAEGKSFSTGGDVAGFLAHWNEIEAYSRRTVGLLNEVVLALARLPVPVVAAAQGWTTGGSLGLLLGADIVLLGADARIAPFYTQVGFSPDGGWSQLLPELIGARTAAEVQYLNQAFGAEQALVWGLANRVVPVASLRAEAHALAARIAGMMPASTASTKRLLRGDLARWEAGLAAELEAFVETIQSPGVRESAEAFVNKRKAG